MSVDPGAVPATHSWDDERRARAGLTAACPPADHRLLSVVKAEGAPVVWRTLTTADADTAWSARARSLDLEGLVGRSLEMGLRFVIPGDDEWPEQLDVLEGVEVGSEGGSPLGLWIRGDGHLGRLCSQAVAMVGARAATGYGEHVAAGLAHDLARAGEVIVSGGAYGIDAACHRGALAGGGPTIAWLAGGLDRPYPAGNASLFEQIVAEGVTVSEQAIGAHPSRAGFLTRNRLIAASARATILVEAAARSGARNTVSWAIECGRPVMAVPGPVTSTMSLTPHRLIRDGLAVLVTDAEDVGVVAAPVGEGPELAVGGGSRLFDTLPEHLLTVREALPGRGGVLAGEVALAVGIRVPACLAALAELEELGLARADDEGRWKAVRA